MRTIVALSATLILSLQVAAAEPATTAGKVMTNAEEVVPIREGATVPKLTLKTMDGKQKELHALLAEKPTVLVFYRGGWCPYCNKHLAKLQMIEPKLMELGYQVVAVSPDRPEKLRESLGKQRLNYTLLSDSSAAATKAFGLAFQVDDGTLIKYKSFDIDLDDASGESHHILPVPAVYLIDQQGLIRFTHFDPNYKTRLNTDLLLAKAETLREQAEGFTESTAKQE